MPYGSRTAPNGDGESRTDLAARIGAWAVVVVGTRARYCSWCTLVVYSTLYHPALGTPPAQVLYLDYRVCVRPGWSQVPF